MLPGQFRGRHLDFFILHIIAGQPQRGGQDVKYFNQLKVCPDTPLAGVQIEVEVFNKNLLAVPEFSAGIGINGGATDFSHSNSLLTVCTPG